MAKYFDPFDPDNRDKRPRRKSEEVAAARRDWRDKLYNETKRIMDEFYADQNYILSVFLLENILMDSDFYPAIKRNFNTIMNRLGYVKMVAPTRDGRWRIQGQN